MNRASSRLAAHAGIRQVEASIRADAAADAASAAVARLWGEVLALLRDPPHWIDGTRRAEALFARLYQVAAGVAARLATTATWGYRTAAAAVAASVPERLLVYAAARRTITEGLCAARASTGQDRTWRTPPPVRQPQGEAWTEAGETHRLLESVPTVADILFPGFSPPEVNAVVYASGWEQRLAAATRLSANPGQLANILAGGLAAGKNPREIAQLLRPAVQGVQTTARRIARTESLRVAGAAQDACASQLGDLQIGWQIHSTLSHWSRPWHAARNGTVYYFRPGPGQKGIPQCPVPPEEAPDPRERPPGTPSTAWNCLCFRTPVLREPGATAAAIVPANTSDPLVFGEWFAGADERRRRTAVGTRRYSLVQDLLQRDPDWSDFLDPETWDLLAFQSLKAETPQQRLDRVGKVRAELAHRREQLRQVSAAGFLTGQ